MTGKNIHKSILIATLSLFLVTTAIGIDSKNIDVLAQPQQDQEQQQDQINNSEQQKQKDCDNKNNKNK